MAEFRRIIPWEGFDRFSTPPWQMVPLHETRHVCLRGGAGLTVEASNKSALKVTEINAAALPAVTKDPILAGDRFFKLEGLMWRTTTLNARTAGGLITATLTCDVKKQKFRSLGFHFVRDNAGHHTSRSMASASGWLSAINWIYGRQTNIYFTQKVARNITVPKNLGTVVRWAPSVASEHEWDDVTAFADPTASLNFFFVWAYEQDSSPGSDHADAGTLGSNCLFEDKAGSQVEETLCHEIGHFLGCDDHHNVSRKHELMYGTTGVRGAHIGQQHANIMNF